MLESLVTLLIFAVIIQFIINIIKPMLPSGVTNLIHLVSLALSIALAIAFKLDLFVMLGYQTEIPLFTEILTGVAISAGAEPIYELIEKLKSYKKE